MEAAKNNYRLIKHAYSILNKKNFQEAIAILERALSSGAGEIYVLLLLSVAYLYTDQFGKLARFLTKMKEKNPGYLPLIQLEAYLKLKSSASYEEALRIYAGLGAKYPADAHIRRSLNLLGKTADFPSFQKNARLQDFVSIPRPRSALKTKARRREYAGAPGSRTVGIDRGVRPHSRLRLKIVIAACAAAVGAAVGWDLINSVFIQKAVVKMQRPGRDFSGVDMISVNGTDYDLVKNIKKDRFPIYYQTAREMTGDFDRARRLIKSEKYNEALIVLNGLYSSNINFTVKEKVDFLIKFVINAEDRDYSDISYKTVSGKKFLYRGYAVRWRGTAARVRVKNDSQTFTLRVDGGGRAESVDADVYSGRIIPGLKNGSTIVLEGVIVDFLGKNKTIYIDAKNVLIEP